MKREKLFLTIILVVIGLVFILPAGCAKKEIVKEEAAMEKQEPVQSQETGKEEAPAQLKETAKEKALEEQLAMEREAKEKAMAEMTAKEKAKEESMAEEASAKVEKEASQFADIHFAFDRSDLRPDAREILGMHAKWLNQHTEYVVRIEGNCDERGTVEYNLALGNKRAKNAMKYLVNLGVDEKRVSTTSYGKECPLDPGHNEEAWAKNRRNHFEVIKKK